MVFFLVFYAILTYALVFTAQHSVTLAAQDGARKVLQWQPGAASLAVRANAGRDTALDRSGWITAMSSVAVAVAVCGPGGTLSSTGGGHLQRLAVERRPDRSHGQLPLWRQSADPQSAVAGPGPDAAFECVDGPRHGPPGQCAGREQLTWTGTAIPMSPAAAGVSNAASPRSSFR
ncbi:TadE/TadG family type IV pilus assembly protein [Achromobacter xylosoxidans]